jgi:membrane protein DedA with SNARE-associated domain
MLDVGALVDHWGYAAIAVLVILGNVGVPVPEETVLALGGYLAWDGHLHLPLLIAVGIVSAAVGDQIGYWLGRRYGRALLERPWMVALLPTERMMVHIDAFVARHGAWAVLVARFLPGLRVLAGPVAGMSRMPFVAFTIANVVGAVLYVPFAVGLGYAAGYGFGEYLRGIGNAALRIEHMVLLFIVSATVLVIGVRALRRRRAAARSAARAALPKGNRP